MILSMADDSQENICKTALDDIAEHTEKDVDEDKYTKFITSTEPKLEELQSVYVDSEESGEKMDRPRTAKETIGAAIGGIRNDSRRFYKFVKKYIRRRKDKPTEVQVINIVPENFHTTWASRQASSAISRSSVDSETSTDSGSSKGSSLQVVHDMENEFCIES